MTEGRKLFSDVMAELAHGDVNGLASERLAELTNAVEETGGKGKLVITIDVKKQNKMVIVSAAMKMSKPESALDETMFFVDAEGNLTREDPRQLTFRDVKAPAAKDNVRVLDGGRRPERVVHDDAEKKPSPEDGAAK